jgi:hypothetical protein
MIRSIAVTQKVIAWQVRFSKLSISLSRVQREVFLGIQRSFTFFFKKKKNEMKKKESTFLTPYFPFSTYHVLYRITRQRPMDNMKVTQDPRKENHLSHHA